MVSRKDRQKNLKFVSDLAKAKNWRLNKTEVEGAIFKPHPRFLYFSLTDASGQKFFFKSCSFGKLGLYKRIVKEFKIQKWLGELGGPARKLGQSGQEGPIFWYTAPYFSLEEGIICQEEDISALKPDHLTDLAAQISWLWEIKEKDIPSDLAPYLFLRLKDGQIYPGAHRKILKYLSILKGAFTVSRVDWNKEDEVNILGFFEDNKKEILFFEGKEGILVHGDIAPNNVFFGPQKPILLDWESAYWCSNLLMGLGMDVANFYTRAFSRPELGEKLLEEVNQSSWAKKPFFKKALKIGLIFTVLQKISPMFKLGIYQSGYDQKHFNTLVKILRGSF